MMHINKVLIGVIALFIILTISFGAGITSLVLLGRVGTITQENEKITRENQAAIKRINSLNEELIRTRKENNEANCIAANVGRDAVREAVKAGLLALVPPEAPLTPSQQSRIEAYNKLVDGGLPFRDCSPEGIDAFLKNQPPDPALEHP